MNARRFTGLLLIVAGLGVMAYALLTGQARVALVLIFPVVYGSGVGLLVAIGLLVAGAWTLFTSIGVVAPPDAERFSAGGEAPPLERVVLRPDAPEDEPRTGARSKARSGGVILIGPLPIVWGSDRGAVKGLIVLAIVLMVVVLLVSWAASRTAGF